MTGRIIGTGSCLPEHVVTNDDLAEIMDTSDEWIRTRTGIGERHLVINETTTSMAIEASKKAMEEAGITADQIDLIVFGTLSADQVTPSAACEVQAGIGAMNAMCFDVNAACSGYMYSLKTAVAYIKAGMAKTVLVIGAETLSRMMDYTDRSTSVLFGDGAGASVVVADEKGVGAFDQGSDGTKGKYLIVPNRRNNNPLVSNSKDLQYLYMDGQEVYKFAVKYVAASIKKVLEEQGLTPEDIDWFILHQANTRIIESVSKRLGVSLDKFPMTLQFTGNISAGSVPILLDHANRKGLLKKGNKLVLTGFGGGLTWGTAFVEW